MRKPEEAPSAQDALLALIDAKALAELDDAARLLGATHPWRGEPFATLALVVSGASPDDVAAGEPLCGPAGEAAGKAVEALGIDAEHVFVIATGEERGGDQSRGLALAIEAADPHILMALDGAAAAALADALHIAPLEPGRPVFVRGRVVGAVGEFAGSLGEIAAKARVWAAMKAVAAAGGLKAKGRPKASLESGGSKREGA